MKRSHILSLITVLIASVILIGCEKQTTTPSYYTVHFVVNCEYETNAVLDQYIKPGKKAKKPTCVTIDENLSNYIIYGWYTDPSFTEEWDFRKMYPSSDMTLYAKWGYEYEVKYLLGTSLECVKEKTVLAGETVKEYPSYAVGFEYYGSYSDPEYTTLFDFTKGITSDTNIYMKRSDSIDLYEGSASGDLYDNLNICSASPKGDQTSDVGWSERRTLEDGTECVYVNFGYSLVADPYIEIDLPLDITKSQLITITFKNLGPASKIGCYFTAFFDEDQSVATLTGVNYSETFAEHRSLDASQINMDENGEWTTVTFDLSEISLQNGYSVWGSAKYLGKLRIQSGYVSKTTDDLSNEWLIKSITGSYKEVIISDSDAVLELLSNDSDEEIKEAQEIEKLSETNGFKFPLDNSTVSTVDGYDVYYKKDGVLLHTKNQIELMDTDYTRSLIRFELPLDENYKPIGKTVNLKDYCTLNIKLKNLGYQDTVSIYIYNDEGDCATTTCKIGTNMTSFDIFFLNLYKDSSMYGNLTAVEILYEASGVDNCLIVDSIYFTEYKPYDIQGINFNDKKTVGFSSNDKVEVSYNQSLTATRFNVLESGAEVETTFDHTFTCDGYESSSLVYYQKAGSEITSVKVSYYIDGSYKEYEFALDPSSIGTSKIYSTVLFNKEERGLITGLKLTFTGIGIIDVKEIDFNFSEYSVDYTHSYLGYYDSGWYSGCTYSYDEVNGASVMSVTGELGIQSTYIGYSYRAFGYPYETENFSLSGKKYLKIVYQNRTDTDTIGIVIGVDSTPYGPADGTGTQTCIYVNIKTNMSEYEWDTITIELPEGYDQFLLAKVGFRFSGATLYYRGFTAE